MRRWPVRLALLALVAVVVGAALYVDARDPTGTSRNGPGPAGRRAESACRAAAATFPTSVDAARPSPPERSAERLRSILRDAPTDGPERYDDWRGWVGALLEIAEGRRGADQLAGVRVQIDRSATAIKAYDCGSDGVGVPGLEVALPDLVLDGSARGAPPTQPDTAGQVVAAACRSVHADLVPGEPLVRGRPLAARLLALAADDVGEATVLADDLEAIDVRLDLAERFAISRPRGAGEVGRLRRADRALVPARAAVRAVVRTSGTSRARRDGLRRAAARLRDAGIRC